MGKRRGTSMPFGKESPYFPEIPSKRLSISRIAASTSEASTVPVAAVSGPGVHEPDVPFGSFAPLAEGAGGIGAGETGSGEAGSGRGEGSSGSTMGGKFGLGVSGSFLEKSEQEESASDTATAVTMTFFCMDAGVKCLRKYIRRHNKVQKVLTFGLCAHTLPPETNGRKVEIHRSENPNNP